MILINKKCTLLTKVLLATVCSVCLYSMDSEDEEESSFPLERSLSLYPMAVAAPVAPPAISMHQSFLDAHQQPEDENVEEESSFLAPVAPPAAAVFEEEDNEFRQMENFLSAENDLLRTLNALSSNGGSEISSLSRGFLSSFYQLERTHQLELVRLFENDKKDLEGIVAAEIIASSCQTPEDALRFIQERNRPVVPAAPAIVRNPWDSMMELAQRLSNEENNGPFIRPFVQNFYRLEPAAQAKIFAAYTENKDIGCYDAREVLLFLAPCCYDTRTTEAFLAERN